MQTNKLNLRNVVAIALCLVGLTVFSSCDKEDDQTIIGKWCTSDYHAGDSDTIVFTKDLRVQQYIDYIFANQVIPATYLSPYVTYTFSSNKITFTIHYSYPSAESFDETFEYVLKGKSLTIKDFSNPFSITAEARSDVHFTKIE